MYAYVYMHGPTPVIIVITPDAPITDADVIRRRDAIYNYNGAA